MKSLRGFIENAIDFLERSTLLSESIIERMTEVSADGCEEITLTSRPITSTDERVQ